MLDDSQGITLRSLGGIFLATLCGLMLSMITLAYEVWQQKKQEKNRVHEIGPDGTRVGDGGGKGNLARNTVVGGSKLITVGSKQASRYESAVPKEKKPLHKFVLV